MRRFDTDQWIDDGVACVQSAAVPDGPWVTFTDAQSAIDAANQRATDAERRLALAVAEVKAWRCRPPAFTDPQSTFTVADFDAVWDAIVRAKQATDADPVLAKMIGGGE